MKPRSLMLIALIVLLPLAALTWATLRIEENEQLALQQNYRALMQDRLQDINATIRDVFHDIERTLNTATAVDKYDASTLRNISRKEPQLSQLFVLTPKGQLYYPNPAGELTPSERIFLIRAARMFTGQDLQEAVARTENSGVFNNDSVAMLADAGSDAPAAQKRSAAAAYSSAPPSGIEASSVAEQSNMADSAPVLAKSFQSLQTEAQQQVVQEAYNSAPVQNFPEFESTSGWFVWYWDRGLNLIYWQRRPSGHIVGCALERARWMADLIGQLPETVHESGNRLYSIETRIRLVNSSATPVYQWGPYEPGSESQPLCEVPLAVPLAAWRLQCFVPMDQLTAGTGRSVYVGLFAAVAIALVTAVFLFVREYARDMNEAAQQVSFVNQVSHELKTPLTNIRMYAELLDEDLESVEPSEAEQPRKRLDIILSEGARLSRLIGNVLTFARQKRKTLQLRAQNEIPTALIEQVVDRFRPTLDHRRIDVEIDGSDGVALNIDADFVEQILGNLISNVEKYAADGQSLRIESRVKDDILTINVRDCGPGIEPAKRSLIFEPFARVSNDISSAAGTGIGLSIARDLARLHGGDLRLMDGNNGCWFQVTIRAAPSGSTSESSP